MPNKFLKDWPKQLSSQKMPNIFTSNHFWNLEIPITRHVLKPGVDLIKLFGLNVLILFCKLEHLISMQQNCMFIKWSSLLKSNSFMRLSKQVLKQKCKKNVLVKSDKMLPFRGYFIFPKKIQWHFQSGPICKWLPKNLFTN